MKRETDQIRAGFTMVELLTTMAVVAILLGLLIPALNEVSKMATNVKQKAQLSAIGMALEAFSSDLDGYGDYPPSAWGNGSTYGRYSASQRLAEAVVGRDGLGFHPDSRFHQDGLDASGNPLYYPDFETNYVSTLPAADQDPARAANLAARKGPYLELEKANAMKLSDLDVTHGLLAADSSYVLLDMYKSAETITGKDVGMPILYYRANQTRIGNDPTPANWATNTYNIQDSYFGSGGFLEDYCATPQFSSNPDTNSEDFYGAIQNPNFTSPARPYRAESFILQSAGADGRYGTQDDVFNFDQDN